MTILNQFQELNNLNRKLSELENNLVHSVFRIYKYEKRFVLVTLKLPDDLPTEAHLSSFIDIALLDSNYNHVTDISMCSDTDLKLLVGIRMHLKNLDFPPSTENEESKFLNVFRSRIRED